MKSANNKTIRDNEPLWEACKKEAIEKMGKFSARAMQQAVVLYKKRGGDYVGTKSSTNSLSVWAKKNARPLADDL